MQDTSKFVLSYGLFRTESTLAALRAASDLESGRGIMYARLLHIRRRM